jgi:hypothetical protein
LGITREHARFAAFQEYVVFALILAAVVATGVSSSVAPVPAPAAVAAVLPSPCPTATPSGAKGSTPAPCASPALATIGRTGEIGRKANLVGIAQSASTGTIDQEQIAARPLLRPGEILEEIPGLTITQHSGGGKANQYYLRGFQLDHGTDLDGTINGIPINLGSHAHGQGYSDINYLIPELVSYVEFKKGVYFADQGDFATSRRRASPSAISATTGFSRRMRRRSVAAASCMRPRSATTTAPIKSPTSIRSSTVSSATHAPPRATVSRSPVWCIRAHSDRPTRSRSD